MNTDGIVDNIGKVKTSLNGVVDTVSQLQTKVSELKQVRMEIPAGKWCEGCRFLSPDYEDKPAECSLFDDVSGQERGYEWKTELHYGLNGKAYNEERCPACLAAYPHGATVTVTAKIGPELKEGK